MSDATSAGCLRCGSSLPPAKRRGRARKFCCDECRYADREEKGRPYQPGSHRADPGPHTCQRCGVVWTGRKRKYCAECASTGLSRPTRPCNGCGEPVSRPGHPVCPSCAAKRRLDRNRTAKRPMQTCPVCKESFMPKSSHAQVCSRSCAVTRLRFVRATSAVGRQLSPALPPGAALDPPVRSCDVDGCGRARHTKGLCAKHYFGRCDFTMGYCAECGEPFTSANSSPNRYCSSACAERDQRRRSKHRRSKRIRNGSRRDRISLPKLAIRDGWKCHICTRTVTRKTWSVDHLVPLSFDGTHTWDNVALAHHRCNTLRGNHGHAQLRLVA